MINMSRTGKAVSKFDNDKKHSDYFSEECESKQLFDKIKSEKLYDIRSQNVTHKIYTVYNAELFRLSSKTTSCSCCTESELSEQNTLNEGILRKEQNNDITTSFSKNNPEFKNNVSKLMDDSKNEEIRSKLTDVINYLDDLKVFCNNGSLVKDSKFYNQLLKENAYFRNLLEQVINDISKDYRHQTPLERKVTNDTVKILYKLRLPKTILQKHSNNYLFNGTSKQLNDNKKLFFDHTNKLNDDYEMSDITSSLNNDSNIKLLNENLLIDYLQSLSDSSSSLKSCLCNAENLSDDDEILIDEENLSKKISYESLNKYKVSSSIKLSYNNNQNLNNVYIRNNKQKLLKKNSKNTFENINNEGIIKNSDKFTKLSNDQQKYCNLHSITSINKEVFEKHKLRSKVHLDGYKLSKLSTEKKHNLNDKTLLSDRPHKQLKEKLKLSIEVLWDHIGQNKNKKLSKKHLSGDINTKLSRSDHSKNLLETEKLKLLYKNDQSDFLSEKLLSDDSSQNSNILSQSIKLDSFLKENDDQLVKVTISKDSIQSFKNKKQLFKKYQNLCNEIISKNQYKQLNSSEKDVILSCNTSSYDNSQDSNKNLSNNLSCETLSDDNMNKNVDNNNKKLSKRLQNKILDRPLYELSRNYIVLSSKNTELLSNDNAQITNDNERLSKRRQHKLMRRRLIELSRNSMLSTSESDGNAQNIHSRKKLSKSQQVKSSQKHSKKLPINVKNIKLSSEILSDSVLSISSNNKLTELSKNNNKLSNEKLPDNSARNINNNNELSKHQEVKLLKTQPEELSKNDNYTKLSSEKLSDNSSPNIIEDKMLPKNEQGKLLNNQTMELSTNDKKTEAKELSNENTENIISNKSFSKKKLLKKNQHKILSANLHINTSDNETLNKDINTQLLNEVSNKENTPKKSMKKKSKKLFKKNRNTKLKNEKSNDRTLELSDQQNMFDKNLKESLANNKIPKMKGKKIITNAIDNLEVLEITPKDKQKLNDSSELLHTEENISINKTSIKDSVSVVKSIESDIMKKVFASILDRKCKLMNKDNDLLVNGGNNYINKRTLNGLFSYFRKKNITLINKHDLINKNSNKLMNDLRLFNKNLKTMFNKQCSCKNAKKLMSDLRLFNKNLKTKSRESPDPCHTYFKPFYREKKKKCKHSKQTKRCPKEHINDESSSDDSQFCSGILTINKLMQQCSKVRKDEKFSNPNQVEHSDKFKEYSNQYLSDQNSSYSENLDDFTVKLKKRLRETLRDKNSLDFSQDDKKFSKFWNVFVKKLRKKHKKRMYMKQSSNERMINNEFSEVLNNLTTKPKRKKHRVIKTKEGLENVPKINFKTVFKYPFEIRLYDDYNVTSEIQPVFGKHVNCMHKSVCLNDSNEKKAQKQTRKKVSFENSLQISEIEDNAHLRSKLHRNQSSKTLTNRNRLHLNFSKVDYEYNRFASKKKNLKHK